MKLRKIAAVLGIPALAAGLIAGCAITPDTVPSVQPATSNTVQSEEQETKSNARRTEAKEKKTENSKQEKESIEQDEATVYADELEYTDTIRWFNASFAILTEANGQDYNIYGGLEKSSIMLKPVQQTLEYQWGITDHDTADEKLNWLMTRGHRTAYAENMEYLKECGIDDVDREDWSSFVCECFDLDEEGAEIYAKAYELYSENGISAFAAWDYSRAISTSAYCYLGDYYTLEESLDHSLEAAKEVQEMFSSWDEFIDSYLLGYECWAKETGVWRRMIYETQKAADDNPYNIDWDLNLEKTW